MGHKKDWIPTRTEDFKVFADNFCTLIVANAAKWNVSEADADKATALKDACDAAQLAADTPATKTSITIAAAKAARDALTAHLRHLKRVSVDPGFEGGVEPVIFFV
jgi:hypothetical protein